jgi:hypothetical protein
MGKFRNEAASLFLFCLDSFPYAPKKIFWTLNLKMLTQNSHENTTEEARPWNLLIMCRYYFL